MFDPPESAANTDIVRLRGAVAPAVNGWYAHTAKTNVPGDPGDGGGEFECAAVTDRRTVGRRPSV
jgi:hypothetical protein